MDFMMNIETNKLDIICDYFNKNYRKEVNINSPYIGYVLYGSFVEQFSLLPVNVQDVDVVVVYKNSCHIKDKYLTIQLDKVNYPINIEFISLDEFYDCIFEPKFFKVMCNLSMDFLVHEYLNLGFRENKSKVRNTVSSVCSKAFNKGKKKLTIEQDYNQQLGLKNLYHSVKFLYFTKWKSEDKYSFDAYEFDVLFLNTYYNNLHKIYNNSTGTLEERCNEVINYAKPIFNSAMTDFRKIFPK